MRGWDQVPKSGCWDQVFPIRLLFCLPKARPHITPLGQEWIRPTKKETNKITKCDLKPKGKNYKCNRKKWRRKKESDIIKYDTENGRCMSVVATQQGWNLQKDLKD